MTIYAIDGIRPDIHEDTWIAPDANVIGNVTLKRGASIWFGCTIRGDNDPIVIGMGTNVQENCVFHTDAGAPLTLGDNCTIGHKVILHGCTVGDNTLIGMGATILNHARIGNNCLIGAGALITEGKEIPDGSMVLGAPGKVVRQLDEKAIRMIEANGLHYQENMRRFRAGLTVVE